eukprot:IDg19653t1
MFEARLPQASLLKKVLESIKDVIEHANFDCSSDGMSLQALDQSHAVLVTLTLRSQAFEMYRCDRPLSMGINLTSFSKILKCAGPNDSVKVSAPDDGADVADFVFESESSDRTANFQLKLMDIDSEHMGVPEDTE